ncbi:MAG: hypothetical protein J0H22_03205, partial [Actinobacteria bacterium]|nr:hypothetical protein [Actinomycetota bacterium]
IVLTREHSDPMTAPFDPHRVAENFARLEAEVMRAMQRQAIDISRVVLHREIDIRYGLQLEEVTTPLAPGPITNRALEDCVNDFERRYARLYGEGSGFAGAGIHGRTGGVGGCARATSGASGDPSTPSISPTTAGRIFMNDIRIRLSLAPGQISRLGSSRRRSIGRR